MTDSTYLALRHDVTLHVKMKATVLVLPKYAGQLWDCQLKIKLSFSSARKIRKTTFSRNSHKSITDTPVSNTKLLGK